MVGSGGVGVTVGVVVVDTFGTATPPPAYESRVTDM